MRSREIGEAPRLLFLKRRPRPPAGGWNRNEPAMGRPFLRIPANRERCRRQHAGIVHARSGDVLRASWANRRSASKGGGRFRLSQIPLRPKTQTPIRHARVRGRARVAQVPDSGTATTENPTATGGRAQVVEAVTECSGVRGSGSAAGGAGRRRRRKGFATGRCWKCFTPPACGFRN